MRMIVPALAALLLASGAAWAVPDSTGQDKPSGPQGPGQHGQPGPDGKSGPLIEEGPAWLSGFVVADSGKDSQNDRDQGGGNQPHAPGQTTNPNPGK